MQNLDSVKSAQMVTSMTQLYIMQFIKRSLIFHQKFEIFDIIKAGFAFMNKKKKR